MATRISEALSVGMVKAWYSRGSILYDNVLSLICQAAETEQCEKSQSHSQGAEHVALEVPSRLTRTHGRTRQSQGVAQIDAANRPDRGSCGRTNGTMALIVVRVFLVRMSEATSATYLDSFAWTLQAAGYLHTTCPQLARTVYGTATRGCMLALDYTV